MPWIAKASAKNVTDAAWKNDMRKEGDVLTIYNTYPKRSEREEKYWPLMEISEEETKQFRETCNKIKEYYKAESTEWTDKFPEKKDGWEDEKGNVYELKEKPFLPVNHDPITGFKLNVSASAKNKETVLITAPIKVVEGK